jgi:hypothetical protein
MSVAVREKSVETKGSKSDMAEPRRTSGKGRYQAKARETIGVEGVRHRKLARKRRMREREDRGIGPMRANDGQIVSLFAMVPLGEALRLLSRHFGATSSAFTVMF